MKVLNSVRNLFGFKPTPEDIEKDEKEFLDFLKTTFDIMDQTTNDDLSSFNDVELEEDMKNLLIIDGINQLSETCYNNAKAAGWWDQERNFGEMIALIHSEISEALEGERKGLKDDHLPHRDMVEVELADTIIRICDMAGSRGYNLGEAIVEKLEYNKNRADHKKENRMKDGGKKF